jgi:Kef-type K+ transport system membrane component KefB
VIDPIRLLGAIEAPHDAAFRFFVLALVIVAAPKIAERLRIPGMVGLLIGGMLVGPAVLGWLGRDSGDVSSLGTVGLLYLMFGAGLELDLNLFARHRRAAIVFALMTFAFPMCFGFGSGRALGFGIGASLLLGSLWASHTLVVYPQVRDMGLARNPAVAATVGATVITDTLALVVLAIVAGTASGTEGTPQILGELALGFVLLFVVGFVVLPRVVRWVFTRYVTERSVRFMVVFASFLGLATLGEVFGIEPIVGAFFAGLALNRLVPNEGALMERIEFFGTALFIPTFLVSVGLLIKPAVMVQPATLGLAGVFLLACVGGKVVAAALTRPTLRFTAPEAGVVFSLSVAQAAATLAAAFVGLEVGLLSERVVNATLVVIAVTLVLAPAAAGHFGRRVPLPEDEAGAVGRTVLLGIGSLATLPGLTRVAAAVAAPDSGVVIPLYVVARDDRHRHDAQRIEEEAGRMIAAQGVDAEVVCRVDDSVTQGILHAVASEHATLVVVGWAPAEIAGLREVLRQPAEARDVTALFCRAIPEAVTSAILVVERDDLRRYGRHNTLIAGEMARRLGSGALVVRAVGRHVGDAVHRVAPDATVEVVDDRRSAFALADPAPGTVFVVPANRRWAEIDDEVDGIRGAGVVVVERQAQVSDYVANAGGGLWGATIMGVGDGADREARR